MKNLLLLFSILFFLCINFAEAQTNAGIPDASTVLVVYNGNSGISDSVKTIIMMFVEFLNQTSFAYYSPAAK